MVLLASAASLAMPVTAAVVMFVTIAGGFGSWYGVCHSVVCVIVRARGDVIHARALTHVVQCARWGLESL